MRMQDFFSNLKVIEDTYTRCNSILEFCYQSILLLNMRNLINAQLNTHVHFDQNLNLK